MEYLAQESTGDSFYVPNGPIDCQVRLAMALRYFAGGSYLDILMSHGVGKTDFYNSVWAVVHAVNNANELMLQFPQTIEECAATANEFAARSKAGFNNCVGCIDGVLLWIEKPGKKECATVGVDSGKFYCGRKGKYGLNMQAVCDARRRFTFVSIQHPASASDYLSFATSTLHTRLTESSPLPKGYCLYGDNAYINEPFMAVPFPNQGKGPKDDYNYFHSQVRINIECAFGILTNRWRLLKSPLSSKLSIKKISALTFCLCKLHNYCIDNGNAKVPSRYQHDSLTLMDFANVIDKENGEMIPVGLLGGGDHFEDIQGGRRGASIRAIRSQRRQFDTEELPRTTMLRHVVEQDIHRSQPIQPK